MLFKAVLICMAAAPLAHGLTPDQQKKVLEMHNELRRKLALGEVKTAGGQLPQAANMLQMVYDQSLEDEAHRWAKKCTSKHTPVRNGYGQNIGETSYMPPEKVIEISVKMWWKEHEIHNGQLKFAPESMNAGHFTQMAWAESNRLGCALQRCEKADYLYCNYGPAGNVYTRDIYKPGKPCSQCGGTCNNGLCA